MMSGEIGMVGPMDSEGADAPPPAAPLVSEGGELLSSLLEELDSDGSGRPDQTSFDAMDADGDGIVSGTELAAALERQKQSAGTASRSDGVTGAQGSRDLFSSPGSGAYRSRNAAYAGSIAPCQGIGMVV